MTYPTREKFFAHKFLRILTRDASAMQLGPDACWLLTVVVMQEDACRYRRPVAFWNERLLDLCGWADKRTLVRTRAMLCGAGWLVYEPAPAGSRRPGMYQVAIPDDCEGREDAPVEDGEDDPRGTCNAPRDVPRDVVRDEGRDAVRYDGRDVVRDGVRHVPLSNLSLYPVPESGSQANAPAPDDQTDEEPKTPKANRQILYRHLEQLGLDSSEKAAGEWSALASGRAKCSTAAEALEFISYAVQRGIHDGVDVSYAKHAKLFADAWVARRA